MTSSPARWTTEDLTDDAAISAAEFRADRLAISSAWESHYKRARKKFDLLLKNLNDLDPGAITDANLANAYGLGLGDAIRYLAGPPISDDDLQVIAEVDSLAPGVLKKKPELLRKAFGVIERVIDPYRFPWVKSGKKPTKPQRDAALLASSVLLAAQSIATERRNDG
jgi:hypothetical protein